jgi:hypothetical protein
VTAPVPEHDPLCPFPLPPGEDGRRRHVHAFDFCDLIARVRADEATDVWAKAGEAGAREARRDLYEQIQALPHPKIAGSPVVFLDDVLALLSGAP